MMVSAILLVALIAVIIVAIADNPQSEYPPLAAAPTSSDAATSTTSPSPTNENDSAAGITKEPETAGVVTEAAVVETEPAEATEGLATPSDTATPAVPTADEIRSGSSESGSATRWSPELESRLGEERRVEEGGFAFRPVTGYSLEFAGDSVTLSASENGNAAGALMLLHTAPATNLVSDGESDLDGAFNSIVASMSARRLVQSGDVSEVTIGGIAGQAVDIVSESGDSELAGRIAVTRPDEERLFLGVAFAPKSVWNESGRQDFQDVLSSVEFFPAVVTPEPQLADATPPTIAIDITGAATPAAESTGSAAAAEEAGAAEAAPVSPFGPETEWRILSNGNFVNGISPVSQVLWTATDGGIVAWNKGGSDHTKYTTLDGLSTNRALAVVNCPLPGLGVVFATDRGLQVYDPQSDGWTVFDSADSPMSHDDVTALFCDEAQGVLIAAYALNGLDVFSADTGEWTLVNESDGLETGIIRKIAVTEPQTIWIASQLGLTRFRDGTSTLFSTDNSPMTANGVTALASNGTDTVWLATAGDLYRTDGENWQTYNQETVTGTDFPNGSITGLAVGPDGSVWVGSDQTQVCRFDPAIGGCAEFFNDVPGMANAPLTSLFLDSDGAVYYTTSGAGVSVYEGGQWSTYFAGDEPVMGNRIRSMVGDTDGSVWIATRSGVSQVASDDQRVHAFTAADSPLLSHDVRAVQPASEGSVWFGSAGGANFYQDPNWESYTEADGLAGNDIRALALDSQSRTWIGSETGLSIWTGNGFFNLTTDNGLPSDVITSLLSDGDLVWIGTDTGLLRFQDNQLQVFNTGNINLPSNGITALALDADGSLLVGTESGLARFRDSDIMTVPDIPSEPVQSIAAGETGEIWLATGAGELYYFDGAQWTAATNIPELPSPLVSALYIDGNGDVWFGADGGGVAVASQ
ncbi:MAG: two-component regulator propeller domain-containing protein [Caldilineaceae bacterium]